MVNPHRQQILDEVAHERQRQITVHGFGVEHDDEHRGGELAVAASCYALAAGISNRGDLLVRGHLPLHWPWDGQWWKPKTPRQDLVRAAALIVAEIERIDRAEQRGREQPDFIYLECQDCGFDSVQKADFDGSDYCPLCAADNGRDVQMRRRVCLNTDRPEGRDARRVG